MGVVKGLTCVGTRVIPDNISAVLRQLKIRNEATAWMLIFLAITCTSPLATQAFPQSPGSSQSLPSGHSDPTHEGQAAFSNSLSLVLPAESLGRDDLLEISVSYCPELSGRFRIGSDGTLSLPLLRSSLPAAGLTPVQIGAHLKEALISEQIMADPSVTVSVVEYRSRTVIVLGAVLHPLSFQATGETTLLDAIAMAGGLSATVGSSILVISSHRTSQGTMERLTQTIPVDQLALKGDPSCNPALHGGEEIRVQEAGKVFIAGSVVHPGIYAMQGGDHDTTVLKALALSQGLATYSSSTAYIYRRLTSGGDRQEIQVPLSRIISRKDRDVPLIADDILYVPEANGKRRMGRVLSQIVGFGQTTAAGLLIYK